MKACIFCKKEFSSSNRAKEHIVPDWLLREWNLSDAMLIPTHFDPQGRVLSSRTHNLGSLLSGNVCSVCNNGWMSILEHRCKPLIRDLAGGKRRLLDILDAEALLLARWTVKTAYSLHAASNYRPIVDDSHFGILNQDEYRLPKGVYVVGHCYKSGKDFSWCQHTTWPGYICVDQDSTKDFEALTKRGYKIALKLGGLFLMVYFNPLTHARECLYFRRHIPLYPRWSHPVTWIKEDRAWPAKDLVRFFWFAQSLGVSIGADSPNSPLIKGHPATIRTKPKIIEGSQFLGLDHQ